MAWWDRLLEEMSAEAAAYEADGWETLELHTGDVTPRDGSVDELALDVLIPDNEFATLESVLEDGIDGYDLLLSTPGEYVAFLLALEDSARELAILVPAYYSRNDDSAATLLRKAVEAGELSLILRTLTDDRVEVTLEEPERFLVDDE
jgi:hypothetical protein